MALSKQLEALGSTLKSQIMSDLNSWEDRRRGETPVARGKKFTNKRARPQPLPEISHETLVEIRRVRHALYTENGEVAREVINWAIGVLAVFVSVADMKGNCRLSDLIGLPGAKTLFQLLVLAAESCFARVGMEEAETALVAAILSTTKDPRAVEWILTQYGATHTAGFPRCLHMYAVSRLAQGSAASGAEKTGLSKAIESLAATHPEENARALTSILDTYREAITGSDSSALAAVADDDPRRFILFYMLQSQQSVLLGNGTRDPKQGTASSGQKQGVAASEPQWLGSAIRREMREGFSRLLVFRDDAFTPRPLADAIEVLFCDPGRAKRISDQPLNINRVLAVFTLISAVVQGHQGPADQRQGTAASYDGSGDGSSDVYMQSSDADDGHECLAFIDACQRTLSRLVAREQEMMVLGQLPKTVKNMPQPIPNGLHEAVQRGGRIFNNGPIALPVAGEDDIKSACKAMFQVLSAIAPPATLAADNNIGCSRMSPAGRLYVMVYDTVPKLVEILAARIDSPALLKHLLRRLVDGWPVCAGSGSGDVADIHSALALYRSLLALSEGCRGLLFQHLPRVFAAHLGGDQASPEMVYHAVGVLAMAVDHQTLISMHPARAGDDLRGVAEVVGCLCGVLSANWQALWAHCFRVSLDDGDKAMHPGAAWAMRVALVRALTKSLALRPTMRTIDKVALAERALAEQLKIQAAMSQSSAAQRSAEDVGGMLTLARALLALICLLARSPGIGRMAMERILQHTLQHASDTDTPSTISGLADSGDIRACSNMLRGPAGGGTEADPMQMLGGLLEGRLLPAGGDRGPASGTKQAQADLAMAERLLWQNAVRPVPKYPRANMRKHDRTNDAWALSRPKAAAGATQTTDASAAALQDPKAAGRPLTVLALLSVAQADARTGMAALGQLLEEYYIDSIPSMPPMLLDERLGKGRLQLLPVEMELLQDIRRNADLELLVFELLRDPVHGAPAAKRLVSALLVALAVYWNGALGEPTTNRPDDLAFTTRLVARVVDAYADHDPCARGICAVFSVVGGRDLARLLHQFVWRWVVHRMPAAEDDAQKLLRHILRRYIVRAAPLFHVIYPPPKVASSLANQNVNPY